MSDVDGRRQRFIEAGGVDPAAARRPNAVRRDPRERRLPSQSLDGGRRGLRAAGRGSVAAPPEAARRDRARGPGRGRRGGRSRRGAGVPAPRPAVRDSAPGGARAGVGDDRGGRAGAVGLRRRLPGRRGRRVRRRAAPRDWRAEGRRRRARPVRGDGDGEAGGRGAELLVGRRRLLLLLDRRRGRPARRRCTITTPSCRIGCRRRWSSRPATGWCSGSICACGRRGATVRCATRSPPPSATTRPSGGPGSGRRGCARGPPPAIARWATSCSRSSSRSSFRAASVRA